MLVSTFQPTTVARMLWDLPRDLVGSVLTTFLTIHSLRCLDLACCSRESRSYLLEVLSSGCELEKIEEPLRSSGLLKWAKHRGFRIRKMRFRVCGNDMAILASTDGCFNSIELIADPSHDQIDLVSALPIAVGFKVRKIHFTSKCVSATGKEIMVTKELEQRSLFNLEELTCCIGEDSTECALKLIETNSKLRVLDIRAHGEVGYFFHRLQGLRGGCPTSGVTKLCVTFDDTDDGYELNDAILEILATCFPSLVCLRLNLEENGRDVVTLSYGWAGLTRACPHLQEMYLGHGIVVEETALVEFFTHAHRLRVLQLRSAVCFTDAMLLALAGSNGGVPHLEELWMVLDLDCLETVDSCAAVLGHLRRCRSFPVYTAAPILQQHTLTHMTQLSTLEAPLQELSIVAKTCPTIRALLLAPRFKQSNQERLLLSYLQSNPLLESLTIGDNIVTGRILTALARCCPHLHTIVMTECVKSVSSADLVKFARGCSKLRIFHIRDLPASFNDTAVLALAQHCYYLEDFVLPAQAAVTEAALVQLATSCKRLRAIRGYGRAPTMEQTVRNLHRVAVSLGRMVEFDCDFPYVI